MATREFSASGIITENEGYVGLHLFLKSPKRAVTRFVKSNRRIIRGDIDNGPALICAGMVPRAGRGC